MSDGLSVQGVENVAKLIDALSTSQQIQILVWVDDYQSQQPSDKRWFTVEIARTNYDGSYFVRESEEE